MSYPPLQPLPYHSVPPSDPDISHIQLLAILHYVWGSLTLLFSCVAIFYIVMGIVMLNNPAFFNGPSPATQPGPAVPIGQFGWIFVIMGGLGLLVGWTVGILTIYSGRCMQKRRKRMLSLAVAGISCLSIPFGTTLGVFTFLVLLRESVERQYLAQELADRGPPRAM